MSDTPIDVFIDLPSFPGPVQAGRLWSHFRKGRESASFEYNKEWLANPHRFALEPLLPLADGTFHTNPGQSVFGAIGDSTPDRWGRILMRRAELARARTANESPHTLSELDYLLRVNDEARQGGAALFTGWRTIVLRSSGINTNSASGQPVPSATCC